ncbi:MAG: hypothetical protein QOF63_3146 [Thermoanaerobaculia bacterium]|jgi:hypothetical protein|nr:hypothetical protein [Thermoanaerobaculia bacterium]
MKFRAAVVLLMLFAMRVPSAVGGCPDDFIKALNDGTVPLHPPIVEGCGNDYSQELAKALVSFKKSRTADEVRAVMGLIKAAHTDARRGPSHRELALALERELPNYHSVQTASSLDSLDNFADFNLTAPDGTAPITTTSAATSTVTTATTTSTSGTTGTGNATATTGTTTATDTSTTRGEGHKSNTTMLLLGALTLLLLAALTVGGVVFIRKKRRDQREEGAVGKRLNYAANKVEASLKLLDDRLQQTAVAIDEKLEKTTLLKTEDLTPLFKSLGNLRETVEQLVTAVSAIETTRQVAAPDQVAMEHRILAECWKQFRANGEASAAFDAAMQEVGKWESLVSDLAKLVPADLKPTFDAVLAPCKEHQKLVSRINAIPRLISGDANTNLEDADKIKRAREFADLLRVAQSPSDPSNRLNFRFNTWVTDAFLPFADIYLQRYQQARLEKRDAPLQEGANLVRKILQVAAVEPIDVVLGETPFDSTLHVGRSATYDPRFSDGVITGVVRNGFVEGGQQVIRQPEVIVNRMR